MKTLFILSIEQGYGGAERSIEIAQHEGRPVADFRWHAVGKAVGNVRNQGAELIAQIDEAS